MVSLAKIRAADRGCHSAPESRVALPLRSHRKQWAVSLRANESSDSDSGFTLLELLIVMVIIATLAAMAIPAYTRNVLAAREAVLKEDLQVLRTAIDSYTVDKQKAPQSLDDLVTAGYLKAIPKDPITGRTDTWITSQSDTLDSVDQTDSGIDDVHSGAQLTATDGTAYNTW